MRLNKSLLCTFIAVFAIAALSATAQDPQTIQVPFQGRATGLTGTPIPDGSQVFTFRIFDSDVGGVLLWEETQNAPTANGLFNVVLGNSVPIEVTDVQPDSGQFHWFETEVNGEVQTTRIPILAVPTAGVARRMDGDVKTEQYHMFLGATTNVEYELRVTSDTTGNRIRLTTDDNLDTTQIINIKVDSSKTEVRQESTDGIDVQSIIVTGTDTSGGGIYIESQAGSSTSGGGVWSSPGYGWISVSSALAGDSAKVRQYVDNRKPEITIDKWEGPSNKDDVKVFIDSAGGGGIIIKSRNGTDSTGGGLWSSFDEGWISISSASGADSARSEQFVDTRAPEITIDKWEGPDKHDAIDLGIDSSGVRVILETENSTDTTRFFMKIDSVKGESSMKKRKGAAEIQSWSWGVDSAGSFTRGQTIVLDTTYSMDLRVDSATGDLRITCKNSSDSARVRSFVDNRGPEITLGEWKGSSDSSTVRAEIDSLKPVFTIGEWKGPSDSSVIRSAIDSLKPVFTIGKWEGPDEQSGIDLFADSLGSAIEFRATDASSSTGTRMDTHVDVELVEMQLHGTPIGSTSGRSVGMSADSGRVEIKTEIVELSLFGQPFLVEATPTQTHMQVTGIGGTNPGMHVISDGFSTAVGIGTPSPTEELQVIGDICATGTIGACSDRRFKSNITPIDDAVEKLTKLQGVEFDWNRSDHPDREFSEEHQIGVVAQDVNEVVPSVVTEGDDGYFSVDYGRLTPLIIEAVKSQQGTIDRQQQRIERLEAQVAQLSALLTSVLSKNSQSENELATVSHDPRKEK